MEPGAGAGAVVVAVALVAGELFAAAVVAPSVALGVSAENAGAAHSAGLLQQSTV
jgi:hypothetical protein